MRITGIKSICHSKGVKPLPPTKQHGDTMYFCLECERPCDHYYEAEIERIK